MRRWTMAGVVAVVAMTRGAAAESAEPLSLAYEAPAGCPDRAGFFAQVTGRTNKVRAQRPDESARSLHVRVAKSGAGFIGHLHFEAGGSKSSPRVVEGGTCSEVVEALGLIAALAVDPTASTAPLPAPAEPPATIPEWPTASTPTAPASPPPPAPEASPAEPPPTAGGARATHLAAGWALEGSSLAGFVFGYRFYAELVLWGGTLVSPSFRAGFAQTLNASRDAAIGSAFLRWTSGYVEGCPLHIALRTSGSLALRPCAAFEAGVLSARASGITTPRDRSRAWLAADALARLTWSPVQLLSIDVEAGARVPLTRETFFFQPGIDVYQAPAAVFFGRLGASVRFF